MSPAEKVLKRLIDERELRRDQLKEKVAALQAQIAALDMAIDDLESAFNEVGLQGQSASVANGIAMKNGRDSLGVPKPQHPAMPSRSEGSIKPRPGVAKSSSVRDAISNAVASLPEALKPKPQSITKLCLDFVNEHSHGLRSSEIAGCLVGKLDSKSSDPRRVIMNTLINLADRGVIRRDEDGKYRPIDDPAKCEMNPT